MDSKGSFRRSECEDESDIDKNGSMEASINFWHSEAANIKDLKESIPVGCQPYA